MLARYSDFSPLIDRVFSDSFFKDFAAPTWKTTASEGILAADIVQTDDAMVLHLDMPGFVARDIQVKWDDDTLTVSAERKFEKSEGTEVLRSERRYGRYARSFVLPQNVDGARCEAEYVNGVLKLTLPKKEDAKPRSIDIKVAG